MQTKSSLPPAPITTKRNYSVTIVDWNCWEIWLDADSPEAAEAEAERIFIEDGDDAFRHRGCGIDNVDAEERGPAEGGVA